MGENKVESCNCTIIHKDIVEKVRKSLPDEEVLYDLADLFKAFSDSTRIKILHALSIHIAYIQFVYNVNFY